MIAMEMNQEDYEGAPRGVLLALGAVMIIGVVAIGSVFIFRLQPPLGGSTGSYTTHQGEVLVILPSGVSTNLNLNFNPRNITVVVGVNSTVTWQNQDSAKHTVTATDHSFDSGDLLQGQVFSHTFNTPGTYDYICIYHSFWMKGAVTVKAAS